MSKPSLSPINRLGDPEIRKLLIESLQRETIAPKAILEELRVHNGNAIADVVSIYNYAHCYEIKSDKDNVERALKQSKYYDLAFRKVTLVTTEKQSDKARRLVPSYWGIIIVKTIDGKPTLLCERSATNTPSFDKKIALLTLWKSELIELAQHITTVNITKKPRSALSTLIAEEFNTEQLAQFIGNQLVCRQVRSKSLGTYKSYVH